MRAFGTAGRAAAVILLTIATAVSPAGCARTGTDPDPDRGHDPADTVSGAAEPGGPPALDPPSTSPAAASFRTQSATPLVLVDEAHGSLFVQENALWFQPAGRPARLLYQWSGDHRAQAWREGDLLLLGTDPPERGDWPFGHWWLAIDLDGVVSGEGGVAPLETYFVLSDVITLRRLPEPFPFYVVVRNGPSFAEFLYVPDEGEFLVVNPVAPPGQEVAEIRRRVPSRLAADFRRVIRFRSTQGDLYALHDELGVVVYAEHPQRFVQRYFDVELVDTGERADVHGNALLLGRFRGPAGEEFLALLTGSGGPLLPIDEALWVDAWTAAGPEARSFFRVREGAVDVVHYGPEWDPGPPLRRTFDTQGADFVERRGSLLVYTRGGAERYLSVYDLMHAEPQRQEPPAVDSLWLQPLPGGSREERGPLANPWWPPARTIRVPQLTVWNDEDAQAPDTVRAAVHEVAGDGDVWSVPRFRRIDGTWYALLDERLYRVNGRELEELARLPVQTAASIAEGASVYTAHDFTRVGDRWYVADTFADRLPVLNETFDVVGERTLPGPWRIEVSDEGLLEVTALDGLHRLDGDLRAVEREPLPWESPDAHDDVEVRAPALLEDARGLTWLVHGPYLYQWDRDGHVRRYHVGASYNVYAGPTLLAYRDQVLLLFDNRVLVFGPDGGWRRTIRFPRIEPDAIGYMTSLGEGSAALDGSRGRLYVVQGYRVLAVDLESGEGETLFMQDGWHLGRLVLHGDRLYVSAQVGDVPRLLYTEVHAEHTALLVYELTAGRLTRYLVETCAAYITHDVTEDGDLRLWRYEGMWDEPEREVEWRHVPLADLDGR